MSPLRIAVDARPLAFPMVGITRYTYELILRLVKSPHEWFLYLDRPPLHELPVRSNLQLRIGPMNRTASSTLFAQLAFPRWARRDEIDVFWSPRHHLPLLLPAHVRKLLTIHDMVWRQYPETMSRGGRWVERILMPPAIRAADSIITVSQATRDDVLSWSPRSANKTRVIHPGLCLFESPAVSLPGQTSRYFLFVGTLEPRKNLPRLLRAFARVAEQNAEITLVIVGDEGWGNEALAAQVKALQLEARVSLVGRANDARLVNYYRRATALLMPSLYEGFGLPLLEAMGHGVPVITANRGATAEVAGDAGLLVDPLDEVALADAMLALLDPQRRDTLAAKARLRASHFNWDDAAQAVLQELAKLGGREPSAVKEA